MFEISVVLPILISGLCLVGLVALIVTGRSPQFADRVDRVARSATSAKPKDDKDKDKSHFLIERIIQAGFYRKRSIGFYYAVRISLMALPFVVVLIAIRLGYVAPLMGFMYALVASAFGTVAPSLWLDYRKRQRQTKIRRALPDALDVIIVCVEAGMSLPASLARVSSELGPVHPLLASEMVICKREVQLGCSTGEALRHFAQRFDLEELRSLSSVIQQAEKFGASIAHALRVHAETLRVKRFQRAEELAQQAAVKLVFPTILCIFPALFIVLAGPAVFRIFEMFDKMAN